MSSAIRARSIGHWGQRAVIGATTTSTSSGTYSRGCWYSSCSRAPARLRVRVSPRSILLRKRWSATVGPAPHLPPQGRRARYCTNGFRSGGNRDHVFGEPVGVQPWANSASHWARLLEPLCSRFRLRPTLGGGYELEAYSARRIAQSIRPRGSEVCQSIMYAVSRWSCVRGNSSSLMRESKRSVTAARSGM